MRWRFVVQKCLRFQIVKACHDEPTGGHGGQEKTLNCVRERFWWAGMAKFVNPNVVGGTFYQSRKVPRKLPQGMLEPILVSKLSLSLFIASPMFQQELEIFSFRIKPSGVMDRRSMLSSSHQLTFLYISLKNPFR